MLSVSNLVRPVYLVILELLVADFWLAGLNENNRLNGSGGQVVDDNWMKILTKIVLNSSILTILARQSSEVREKKKSFFRYTVHI